MSRQSAGALVAPVFHPSVGAPGTPSLGGKAEQLLRLEALGAPVPAWFAIPTDLFASLASELVRPGLVRLMTASDEDVPAIARSLRCAVEELSLPLDAIAAVESALERLTSQGKGRDVAFAVRSSAAAEDSSADSFAGQLETFLNVAAADVVSCIRSCWASAFSDRAVRYARARGQLESLTSVGVLVQLMVNSVASGVLFSANPTGSLDELVIVAGYGLGEGIVTDKVECDTYTLDTQEGCWLLDVGRKHRRVACDDVRGVGTRVVSVPPDQVDAPVLSEEQRDGLAKRAQQLSQTLGPHLDIEWSFDSSGKLWLLQARPITSIPSGRATVFDNSNIVESYPGITLPLTASYVRTAYAKLFAAAFRQLGVAPAALRAHESSLANMLGYADGRLYYNLTSWYRLFRLIPGTARYVPVWEEMLGIAAGASRRETPRRQPLLQRAFALLRLVSALVSSFALLGRRMRAMRYEFLKTQEEFRALDLSVLDAHQYEDEYRRMLGPKLRGWEHTLLNDGYAFIFSALARALLRRSGLDEQLFGALLAGDEELESVLPVRRSVAMAEWLRANPASAVRLRPCVEAPLARLEAELARAENEALAAQFRAHLEHFGDRGIEELKLESKSFRDDPRLLLRVVLGYVDADVGVQEMIERERAIRAVAEAQVLKVLRWRLFRRTALAFCLAMARRSIRFRESSRLDRGRAFGMIRGLFAGLGTHLVRAGALAAAEDVYYLRVDELFDFVSGMLFERQLHPIVERRKLEFGRYQQAVPLRRFRTSGPVGANTVPLQRKGSPTSSSVGEDKWQGLGCSAGTLCAEAVVITNPHTAGDVRGKILVTEMTDPGWVFLMVPAAGLVVERGSLLSHTAIIGRELGKPTVVGVRGISTQIQTGDQLEIDGRSGTVRRLSRASSAELE